MNVGERLKCIRMSKNISIYKLSQVSNVSESHIRNLERGTKQATVETLELLVKALEISMAEFFNADDRVTYLTQNEKTLLDYYRTLPSNIADAIIEFCINLHKK